MYGGAIGRRHLASFIALAPLDHVPERLRGKPLSAFLPDRISIVEFFKHRRTLPESAV
jgi:hypothetical protein